MRKIYVGWHTHPDGSILSFQDIQAFLRRDNMQAIGALGHDASYSVLQRTIESDVKGFQIFIDNSLNALSFGNVKKFTLQDLITKSIDWSVVDKADVYNRYMQQLKKYWKAVKSMDSNIKKMNNRIKKRRLSAEEIRWCKEKLEMAEPYTREEADELAFDGPYDYNRMNALFAKEFLEDDDRLKAEEENAKSK